MSSERIEFGYWSLLTGSVVGSVGTGASERGWLPGWAAVLVGMALFFLALFLLVRLWPSPKSAGGTTRIEAEIRWVNVKSGRTDVTCYEDMPDPKVREEIAAAQSLGWQFQGGTTRVVRTWPDGSQWSGAWEPLPEGGRGGGCSGGEASSAHHADSAGS